jgi:hypothetical protein
MSLDDLMTVCLMPGVNEAFKRAVCGELDSRGLSLRQARIRTGIDIDTIGRMRQGDVPRMDKIVAFARGFGLPVNDWLELAGYERIEDPRETEGAAPSLRHQTPEEYLDGGLAILARRYDEPDLAEAGFRDDELLTYHRADEILRETEAALIRKRALREARERGR